MDENEIAKIVVDAAYKIHTTLGPGLLESVYLTILRYELEKRGLKVKWEVPLPVIYDGIQFAEGYRIDILVEDKVILELKSVEMILPVHKKQLLTYLRLADKKLGLLINFGESTIKQGITRLVNGLPENQPRKPA